MTDHELALFQVLPRIVFAAAAALFVYIFIYLTRRQARKKEALRNISEALPGEFGYRWLIPGFRGEWEGHPFAVELLPGSRNSPIRLLVSVTATPVFRLKIHKESLLSSLGKTLGFMKDMETCDPAFNSEFLISTDDESLAAPFLNDTRRRQDILSFFNAGFRGFLIEADKLRIEKPDYTIETDLHPSTVAGTVKKLARLAKAAGY